MFSAYPLRTKLNRFYLSVFSIALIYFLLFTSFYLVCFLDKDGLYKLIIANETYKNLPFTLTFEDLKLIATELMAYISGKIPFLETKVTINGVETAFYSVRSLIHMADVRNIILTLAKINYIAIFLCLLSLFKLINVNGVLIELKKTYKRTVIIITTILVAILIFAAINFDAFFIRFHEILFTNDLWLLDPNEDYIICLLPEKIFMTYGLRIIIAMVLAVVFSVFLLHILSKIQSRQEAK